MSRHLEPGDLAVCIEPEWYALATGKKASFTIMGERLTVADRRYFPGLGAMLQFEEREEDWFVATGFRPERLDG